ncbi:MAG: hypothetical protein HRT88_22715, partial [Lentisphaeraceae bacterium]|nr:hypothetical protein [Lentisphaeraceae bacterium]
DDILNSLKSIQAEVPILKDRYKRLIQHFRDNGIKEIESFVQQTTDRGEDILENCIELMSDI